MPKGGKRQGAGRKAGIPNRATTHAREAIAHFVDCNAPRLQGWLDKIAEKDGARAAFDCVKELLEYHVPKLARTEHTGAGGGPMELRMYATPTDEQL